MFASLSAAGLAAALAFTVVPADASIPTPTAPQASATGTSVAPNWWGGWVGEYFEHYIADFPVEDGTTFELAEGALLPPGLQLAENGVVFGVPTQEIVQVTAMYSTDPNGNVEQHWAVFNIAYPVVGEPGYDFPEYPEDPDFP